MLTDHVLRFRGLRALVVGDAMLDTYLEGTARRICNEGPVPVVQKTNEERAPGGAANTAANLRALGAEVDLVSVIGRDSTAQLLRSCLDQAGVHTEALLPDACQTTVHKLRILAGGQYVVRFDEGEPRTWKRESEHCLLEALDRSFTACDLVVISDYGYGTVSERVLHRIKALRAGRAVPLFIDSKDLRRYRTSSATLVTPNELEAYVAVERRLPPSHYLNEGEVESLGRRLLTLLDAERIAVTMAADGVYLLDREGLALHLPAARSSESNDVGAGDTFLAAVSLAMTSGAGFEDAARIGLVAAGLAVTKRRTSVVHHQELLQGLSARAIVAPHPARELAEVLQAHRRSGRVIVLTNGVFDILHAGHVEFLRSAKSLGDVLVVGVNSDASAHRLKGRHRPINNERERMALVAALDSVDYAVMFDQDEPSDLIRSLRPHIHAKGGDYQGQPLPEAEAVAEVGGRIEILPLAGGISTSAVIDRILAVERTADEPEQIPAAV